MVFVALTDDFPESTGVKRIVQALNANVWTSMEMKDGEMTSIIHLPILLNLALYESYVTGSTSP